MVVRIVQLSSCSATDGTDILTQENELFFIEESVEILSFQYLCILTDHSRYHQGHHPLRLVSRKLQLLADREGYRYSDLLTPENC